MYVTYDYLDGSRSETFEAGVWDKRVYDNILRDFIEPRRGPAKQIISITITKQPPLKFLSSVMDRTMERG